MITIIATASSMDHRVSIWYNPEELQFYNKKHYEVPYDVSKVQNILKLLPENAKVSATNCLVPHLSFRDYIYAFPVINDADYIVILRPVINFPFNKEELEKKINELETSGEWIKTTDQDNVIVFKHVRLS